MIALLLLALQGPPAPPKCWTYSLDNGGPTTFCLKGDSVPMVSQGMKPLDAQPVTIRQANRAVGEVVAIGVGYSADLLTTGWGLARCPTCTEGNFLGPNAESRMALKTGMLFSQAGLIWLLESKGKHKLALGLTIGACAVSAVAIGNNVVHAVRRK